MNSVEADQCLDREHMFVTGFSMGGCFSNEDSQRHDIAAIGPHSGGSRSLGAAQRQQQRARYAGAVPLVSARGAARLV